MSGTLFSVFVGMFIPLGVNGVTFFLLRRQAKGDAAATMKAAVVGFVLRFVFYGVAVAVAAITMELHFGAFILSFTTIFVLLHLAEAMYLRRLFLSRHSKR